MCVCVCIRYSVYINIWAIIIASECCAYIKALPSSSSSRRNNDSNFKVSQEKGLYYMLAQVYLSYVSLHINKFDRPTHIQDTSSCCVYIFEKIWSYTVYYVYIIIYSILLTHTRTHISYIIVYMLVLVFYYKVCLYVSLFITFYVVDSYAHTQTYLFIL